MTVHTDRAAVRQSSGVLVKRVVPSQLSGPSNGRSPVPQGLHRLQAGPQSAHQQLVEVQEPRECGQSTGSSSGTSWLWSSGTCAHNLITTCSCHKEKSVQATDLATIKTGGAYVLFVLTLYNLSRASLSLQHFLSSTLACGLRALARSSRSCRLTHPYDAMNCTASMRL